MSAPPDVKVALVTAAGSKDGLCTAIARRLAAEGYDLALMSRSEGAPALAEELGGIGLTGSIGSAQDQGRLVGAALDRWGRIDAVVNGGGYGAGTIHTQGSFVYPPPMEGRLLDIPDEGWHEGLDLFVLSVVRMARLVTPVMRAQGGGAILNVSSMLAVQPRADIPMTVMRAALAGFVKLYTDRHGRDGIRMNSLLPGWLENHDRVERDADAVPLGRPGTMEELAETALFLLSRRSGYVTGQNILVDGGLSRAAR